MMYHFVIDVIFYQVKFSIFFNAQTTNSTFIDKIQNIRKIDIALCNST